MSSLALPVRRYDDWPCRLGTAAVIKNLLERSCDLVDAVTLPARFSDRTGDLAGRLRSTSPSASPGQARFALTELALWASIYPVYLVIRGSSIGSAREAIDHVRQVIDLERALDLFHEGGFQHALGSAARFFSAYYLVGFAPLLLATLVLLGIRHRERYKQLRTVLLVSLGMALVVYVAFPTAPPRLVPRLDIVDTVGLSGSHDGGSFAGIRFDPYAAMPSIHVGWALLVAIVGCRVTRRRWLRCLLLLHPLTMAITVTATGNHFFLDSIAGTVVALAGLGSVMAVRRSRTARRLGRSRGQLLSFSRIANDDPRTGAAVRATSEETDREVRAA